MSITYNVYAAYEFPFSASLTGFGRVDFSYVDEFNSDFGLTGSATTLPSYEILNLRAGVRGEHWSVTVFVDNAADELATLNVFDPANVGILRNRPRSVGITLRTEF